MKILVADDERDIADAIGIILKYSGYESDVCYDGKEAYDKAKDNVYDGMVLDIMMPKMDGIELVKKLREEGDVTPILMLTAKAEVEDRILGLNNGADDYLPKPFDKGELIARINVMMRRKNEYNSNTITLGNTALNLEGLEITNLDHSLRLSGKEVDVLSILMKNSGKWVTENMLIEKAWGKEDYTNGALKLYIGYLVNKLNAIQSTLTICTENGKYKIQAD